MKARFGLLFLIFWFCLLDNQQQALAFGKIDDVDGHEVTLNQKGRVTVVLYSSQAAQSKTRAAGRSLYPLQGLKKFRVIVVVDLRRSFANWAPDYTLRRVRRSLDKEAKAVRPFYRKNGNFSDPRPDLAAIVDFEGKICDELGWREPSKKLGVILYNTDGREAKRWEDLKDYAELREGAGKLLNLHE